jgi:hypothetical protein
MSKMSRVAVEPAVDISRAPVGPAAAKDGAAHQGLLCPFELQVWTVDRMLNFEITDDPVYEGLELQVFDDPAHGGRGRWTYNGAAGRRMATLAIKLVVRGSLRVSRGAVGTARFDQRCAGRFVGFRLGNSSALFANRCYLLPVAAT